jgi:hypothetical protein
VSGIKITAADKRFSLQVRLRDGYRCLVCSAQPHPFGLHCAHMFSRACRICTGRYSLGGKSLPGWKRPHYCVRLDPDNAVALCYGHHAWMDSHPDEKEALFRSRLGDEAFDALRLRAHGVVSPQFLERWIAERSA